MLVVQVAFIIYYLDKTTIKPLLTSLFLRLHRNNRYMEQGMNKQKDSSAVFKRCNFSLTQEVSDDIDAITFLPRTFKINRSEVVKAGIEALKMMHEDVLIDFLQKKAK